MIDMNKYIAWHRRRFTRNARAFWRIVRRMEEQKSCRGERKP